MAFAIWQDTRFIEWGVVKFDVFLAFRKTNESLSNVEVWGFTNRRVAQFQPTCLIRPVHSIVPFYSHNTGFPGVSYPWTPSFLLSSYKHMPSYSGTKTQTWPCWWKVQRRDFWKHWRDFWKHWRNALSCWLMLWSPVQDRKEMVRETTILFPHWLWTKYG